MSQAIALHPSVRFVMPRSFPGRCALAPSVSDWLEASCRHQPLSERTVLELSRRIQAWQRHPDGPEQAPACVRRRALRARDQLVKHNLRLVAHIWRRHRSTMPEADEGTADAFQEAAISLMRAAEKFDPSRGYRFSTYASFWVRRGFAVYQRNARRTIRLPHDKTALVLRALRLAQEHETATGTAPTLAWLAQRCGPRGTALPVEQLQTLLHQWASTMTGELDGPSLGDGQARWSSRVERLADPRSPSLTACDPAVETADVPDGMATYLSCATDPDDEQRAMLPLLLESLDPIARRYLWHRYLREHPLTPRQIRKVMGLSLEEQQAMEKAAIERLREAAGRVGAA